MNGYMVLVLGGLTGCALFCFFMKRYYQNRMEIIYQELLEKLDRAIGGKMQEAAYDESMDAAVAERLNRVIQISRMNQGRIEKERDTVKSLISDVSHQIKTPLANIMLYAGLLREQDLNEDAVFLADKIQKQLDKLDFFIKALMKSSYAEQEMISIHPEMTNVEEIVSTACQMAELAALKKKISIVHEETEAFCYADKKWTVEALGNILDNAVKYSPENSRVEVGVILYEAFVCIQIKDNGIGIREEEQGRVFERFYRSKDVSNKPGVGIGLYLVREVLSKQGGYAKIKSEYGKGSIIQVFLSRYRVYSSGNPVTCAFEGGG